MGRWPRERTMAQSDLVSQFEGDSPSVSPNSSRRPESGVRIEDQDAIRHITLDRRSRKNAISVEMYRALTAGLADAGSSERIRIVLLSSAGGAFSVGSDLTHHRGGAMSDSEREAFSLAAGAYLRTLASFPKPIVAAVNGLAVGVGATMLLHCDFVVASPFAAFEFSFTRQATAPDVASSVLLGERVGIQRASEWLLFGERINADTLLRFGLVNAIVPLEGLASSAYARAEALAKLPHTAVCETKRLLRQPVRAAVEEAVRLQEQLSRMRHRPPPFF
jgi:enoyl-CoA hydratase/carnithine racemase